MALRISTLCKAAKQGNRPRRPIRRVREAFLHVDCDLYSATKTIFEQIGDMLRDDCIIVFDELFNYRGWENGEYKAFTEFVARKGCTFDYIAYVSTGPQVAVRLTGPEAPVQGPREMRRFT